MTYDEDPEFVHPFHTHLGSISQAEVASTMRASDIFIEGSEVQGFGMQALEAMASGMALVCSDNMGIDTFGTSGYDCMIIPYEDVDMAVAVICRFVDNPKERKKFGQNAMATAAEFSWEVIGREWDRYLKGIRDV